MTLILLEGVDSSGKSSVIKKLVEKYPQQFDSFAFPTSYWIDQQIPLDLIHTHRYHMEFEIDFLLHEQELEKRQRKKTVLLDRYFISNLVYSDMNTDPQFGINSLITQKNYYIPLLLKKIEHLVPDLVIFIRQYNPKDFETEGRYTVNELKIMQEKYSEVLMELEKRGKIKDYSTMYIMSKKDRNNNLLERVETVLKEKNYL